MFDIKGFAVNENVFDIYDSRRVIHTINQNKKLIGLILCFSFNASQNQCKLIKKKFLSTNFVLNNVF
jgi:hypothetical protein